MLIRLRSLALAFALLGCGVAAPPAAGNDEGCDVPAALPDASPDHVSDAAADEPVLDAALPPDAPAPDVVMLDAALDQADVPTLDQIDAGPRAPFSLIVRVTPRSDIRMVTELRLWTLSHGRLVLNQMTEMQPQFRGGEYTPGTIRIADVPIEGVTIRIGWRWVVDEFGGTATTEIYDLEPGSKTLRMRGQVSIYDQYGRRWFLYLHRVDMAPGQWFRLRPERFPGPCDDGFTLLASGLCYEE
ncbi:hypothetical protein KBD34_04690 [Patescibacteria group bacterium]|nr:hypothetical protein [Patescibacteria group bacterium]